MAESRWRIVARFFRGIQLRPYDGAVLLVAIAVIAAFSVVATQRGGPAASVEVRSDDGTFVYPLDVDREIAFEGPLGDTIVHIHDGEVRFTASPCRDKICIAAGRLTDAGQWAACLPNRVFVTVIGEPAPIESGVDAYAF